APVPDPAVPELELLALPSPAGASAAYAGLADKPKINAITLTAAMLLLIKPIFPDDIFFLL
ncbi:MAG: hypothetical protein CMQ22_03035, partial [Gammaproteobacteria bacterium]|nr:hypothetical protein [Gammaproteobacteria bacterium]